VHWPLDPPPFPAPVGGGASANAEATVVNVSSRPKDSAINLVFINVLGSFFRAIVSDSEPRARPSRRRTYAGTCDRARNQFAPLYGTSSYGDCYKPGQVKSARAATYVRTILLVFHATAASAEPHLTSGCLLAPLPSMVGCHARPFVNHSCCGGLPNERLFIVRRRQPAG
jgi:hypothetical protein